MNTGNNEVRVARMTSLEGWREPGQRPEFEEFTIVLEGTLVVEYEGGKLKAGTGQAVVARAGECVRYSTPEPGGAKYIAVCILAFSLATVNCDEEQEPGDSND